MRSTGRRIGTALIVLVCSFAVGYEYDQTAASQEGGLMKPVSWTELLRYHPLFSSLTGQELSQLLKAEASQERVYARGSTIVTAGEAGDSLFLIGSGSVQVTWFGIPVSTLKAGELFGEMAVVERKPRAATVRAREQCTLLEVKGEGLRKLLAAHPELRSKITAKIKDRVEQMSQ